MNFLTLVIDAVEAPMRARIHAGHVVAIVGKFFARGEIWSLADDTVALDHQPRAVGVYDHPLAAQQPDGAVGRIANRDVIHERMRFVRRQAGATVVIVELVEPGGQTGQFS